MGITVYGNPASPYVRSVLIGLEEKGAPYEVARLGFEDVKQRPYLDRHPFGRIPAFEHDGFALYETQAILRYLDVVFPHNSLQPSDARAAARMDQLIGICDWYVFQQIGVPIIFQRFVKPALMGGAPDERVIADAMPQAQTCMAAIAKLAQAPFLTGAQMTIADIMLAAHLSMAVNCTPEGKTLIAPHARLSEWLARMQARPSMQKTDVFKQPAQAA